MSCIPGACDDACIAFKHSMGPSNCDPCADLGGCISECDIIDGIDNLFHSIGPKLSRKGHEDYRCFYIQNVHDTFSLRNVIIYFDGTGRQVSGKRSGTYTAIGVKLADEVQQINVAGPLPPLVGQFMELFVPKCPSDCGDLPDYNPSFKVYFDYNITKWVGNFQTAIRAVMGLPEVVVTVEGSVGPPTDVTFTINYGGHDSRDYPDMAGHKGTQEHSRLNQAAKHCIGLITVPSFDYSNVAIVTTQITAGSPVNTTAVVIPDEITPPPDIPFDYYFRGNPLRIGDLRPKEWVPIWIRRTLPFPDPAYGNMAKSGQFSKLLDDFKIRVDATSP
jgi:hypothetical protein